MGEQVKHPRRKQVRQKGCMEIMNEYKGEQKVEEGRIVERKNELLK